MSEMVERVAKAMDEKRIDLINQPIARIWRDLAQAAIEAMRLPTEGMIIAAGGRCINLEYADDPSYEPQIVWEDMIDEALK